MLSPHAVILMLHFACCASHAVLLSLGSSCCARRAVLLMLCFSCCASHAALFVLCFSCCAPHAGAPHAVLQPQQQAGLQAELEHSMWVAADVRAQNSLQAAQQAKHAQQGVDTAQSTQQGTDMQQGPETTQQTKHAQQATTLTPSALSKPATAPGQHPSDAKSSSSQPASQGQSETALQGTTAQPWGAPHPLQLLHDTLGTIAGKIVLQQVHGSLQRLMAANGKWPSLLKLNAAAVLPNGIRYTATLLGFSV